MAVFIKPHHSYMLPVFKSRLPEQFIQQTLCEACSSLMKLEDFLRLIDGVFAPGFSIIYYAPLMLLLAHTRSAAAFTVRTWFKIFKCPVRLEVIPVNSHGTGATAFRARYSPPYCVRVVLFHIGLLLYVDVFFLGGTMACEN